MSETPSTQTSSLFNTVSENIILKIARNEFDSSFEKLTVDAMENLLRKAIKELVETKKEYFQYREGCIAIFEGSGKDVEDIEERLEYVETAHKYGFCQEIEIYKGNCHLCNDYRCIACCLGDMDNPPWRCTSCYIRTTKKQITELKQKLETCEDECSKIQDCSCKDCISGAIAHLQNSMAEHEQNRCSCTNEEHY